MNGQQSILWLCFCRSVHFLKYFVFVTRELPKFSLAMQSVGSVLSPYNWRLHATVPVENNNTFWVQQKCLFQETQTQTWCMCLQGFLCVFVCLFAHTYAYVALCVGCAGWARVCVYLRTSVKWVRPSDKAKVWEDGFHTRGISKRSTSQLKNNLWYLEHSH